MGRLGRLASIASLGGVALLVAFHGWLFALRLVEGRLGEPEVALRWLAGGLLVATLAGLRRAGVPLVRGRKALVFWVLVVLLHWTATPAAERGLEVEQLLLAVPATVLSVALVSGLLLALRGGIATPASCRPRVARLRHARAPGVSSAFLPLLAARPPPA